MTSGNPLIQLTAVHKTYHLGPGEDGRPMGVEVLKGVSLEVARGEFVALQGTSGSGKSTLLNVIGLLDRATSGEYQFNGRDVESLDDDARSDLRNQSLGFVFQSFHLIPYATALENVMLPGMYSDQPQSALRTRAVELLERVGLGDRVSFPPARLSGGQQQRVAMARALLNKPDVILADEPTGQLDTKTSGEIMELFTEVNEAGTSVILVTHDEQIAVRAHKVIHLADGRIVDQD